MDGEAFARYMREQMEARREEMRNADPNRPLAISWERGTVMRNADPADDWYRQPPGDAPRDLTPRGRRDVLWSEF